MVNINIYNSKLNTINLLGAHFGRIGNQVQGLSGPATVSRSCPHLPLELLAFGKAWRSDDCKPGDLPNKEIY
jgi:hypothetical protein